MGYGDTYIQGVTGTLQRQGQAQANAKLRSGEAWAGALGQIGQTIANLPGQMEEYKLHQAKLEDLDAAKKRKTVLATAYRDATMPDGRLNRDKLGATLTQVGFADALPEIFKGLDEADLAHENVLNARRVSTQEAEQAEMAYAKTLGSQMIAADFNPEIVNGLLTVAKSKGHDVSAFNALWLKQPDQFKSFVTKLVTPPKPNEPFTLNPGDVRFGGDGQQVATNPKPAEKVTFGAPTPAMVGGKRVFFRTGSDGKTYDMAGKVVEQTPTPIVPERSPEPLEAIVGPNGQSVLVPRSQAVGKMPATNREKSTEDERKSVGFYKQMRDAISTIDELEDSITEKELYQIQSLPQEDLVGMANRGQLSEAAKRYLRAFEQFTEARLRPVSGAAINDSEYARDRRTYAKQYGETPTLKEDRSRARNLALGSLGERAGVLKPKDEEPAPPQVLAAGPGEHTFGNGQVWKVSADGKSAKRIK